jgi:hypothetical protein
MMHIESKNKILVCLCFILNNSQTHLFTKIDFTYLHVCVSMSRRQIFGVESMETLVNEINLR